MTPQVKLHNDSIDAITSTRTAQWQEALDAELQDLIITASEIRAKISNAKTRTKKTYYLGKFAKIQTDVMKMVGVKQRIEAQVQASKTVATEMSDALGASELSTN